MEGDVFANFNMAPQSKYGAIWRILDPSAYGFGNARVSLCRGRWPKLTLRGKGVMNIMLLLRAESIQKIGNKPYQIP